LGAGGFRGRWQARHADASFVVNQVNYNYTDFTDSTDCSSASEAPHTTAEPLGGTRGEIIPPGVPNIFS